VVAFEKNILGMAVIESKINVTMNLVADPDKAFPILSQQNSRFPTTVRLRE
jgi:hypothetical protein